MPTWKADSRLGMPSHQQQGAFEACLIGDSLIDDDLTFIPAHEAVEGIYEYYVSWKDS